MDIYESYLSSPAKTEPPLTLFEHSSDVLQVLDYLIAQNSTVVRHHDLIRTAALVHDAGKMAGDLSGGRWVHTSHSAEFLDTLLLHPRFCELLERAHIDLSKVDRGILLKICERHHYQSPELLHSCKDAVLIGIADALASAIEVGVVGQIEEILRRSPYLQVSLELVRSLGFKDGLDCVVHHIDLPGQFVEDLLLADMVFRVLWGDLRQAGVFPVLQRGASLWVLGPAHSIRTVLEGFSTDPKQLYESAFEEQIYESILAGLPAAGSMQMDSLKYILVNEAIARKLAIQLYTRKAVRKVFEKHNLSHLADQADAVFGDGLAAGIERLWNAIKAKLLELLPRLDLPQSITERIAGVAEGKIKRFQVGIYAQPKSKQGDEDSNEMLSKRAENNKRVLTKADKELAADVGELLKLFDASGNYYRSLTNILLELTRMHAAIAAGDFRLQLARVALLDGRPLVDGEEIRNPSLCPICRRFVQEMEAQGLITGNPKMDSVFQTFRKARGQIKVCRWCFLAGYVDLPLATIIKDGQSIGKSREYLLFRSPLPKEKLQWLVDFVRRGRGQEQEVNEGEEQTETADEELKKLELMLGVDAGFDTLAVFGASRRRLSNLKGLVLPSVNLLGNFVAIRIPFERLVGEDKVSGAVQRELVKATMHEFREITGAVSMHYMVCVEAPFSVAGRPVDIEEMRRSNVAYRIANRYARVGRYQQLNSGLFMLLLTTPRQAVTRIFRTRRRQDRGRYAPGEQLVREVTEMAESIAEQDWKFDLGQRITSVLVEVDLLPKARSFWKSPQEKFSGVELTKWLQRLKMAHDESSVRQWGTQLINALKAGRVASREFKEARGIEIRPPGEETVAKILALVEEIITQCKERKCKLSEFSRNIAEMDYYLLFYCNQKAKEAKP